MGIIKSLKALRVGANPRHAKALSVSQKVLAGSTRRAGTAMTLAMRRMNQQRLKGVGAYFKPPQKKTKRPGSKQFRRQLKNQFMR